MGDDNIAFLPRRAAFLFYDKHIYHKLPIQHISNVCFRRALSFLEWASERAREISEASC
jgi:hypothetical protein